MLDLLERPDVALITLVGPGGAGKTRMALAAAERAGSAFPGGVWWVPLAAVQESALVPGAVAQVLGATESVGRDLVDGIARVIGAERSLLVLDNFEHVLDAADLVAQLLAACPGLNVLATSRSPLRLYGEVLREVPPLGFPDRAAVPPADTPEALADWMECHPAAGLFVERAQATSQSFALSAANCAAVAAICARLDGLPLAIELAAGRVGLLGPAALLARLDNRLALLVDGPRDRPERQRTLRGALTWSYDLLTAPERTALRRLAVFEGGFDLAAAETVLNDVTTATAAASALAALPAPDAASALAQEDVSTRATGDPNETSTSALELIASLEEKRLLFRAMTEPPVGEADRNPDASVPEGAMEIPPTPEPRFGMLEVIREYGMERLTASGELEAVRAAHGRYFMDLAARFDAQVRSNRQAEWLAWATLEQANLRATMNWSLEQPDVEVALNLFAWLSSWWYVKSHLTEGRRWARRALARSAPISIPAAKASAAAGILALRHGELIEAKRLFEEAVGMAQSLGDPQLEAMWQGNLGILCMEKGDYEEARDYLEASLPAIRALGVTFISARRIANLGAVAHCQGRLEDARRLLSEALEQSRTVGDRLGEVFVLLMLGLLAYDTQDLPSAEARFREAYALQLDMGDRAGESDSLYYLGLTAFRRGEIGVAAGLIAQSLRLQRELSHTEGWANGLGLAAMVCGAPVTGPPGAGPSAGRPSRSRLPASTLRSESLLLAVRALAKSDRMRAVINQVLVPFMLRAETDASDALRDALGQSAYAAAWAEGTSEDEMALCATVLADLDRLAEFDASTAQREPSGQPVATSATRKGAGALHGPLSAQERQVAALIAEGQSNAAIGQALGVSTHTVATYVTRILNKLDLENRVQIALWMSTQASSGQEEP